MPEISQNAEGGMIEEESATLEERYEQRLKEVRVHLSEMFDTCKTNGTNPIDIIASDDQTVLRKAFGDARIDEFFLRLRGIPQEDKDSFCSDVMSIGDFLFRERFFNPEVKLVFDTAENERAESRRYEAIRFGKLHAKIHPPEPGWLIELPNKEFLTDDDRVLEVSWPDEETPHGIQDVRDSFREMAAYLKEHLEIKAVVAVSWMMSRKPAQRLGFTKYPDVPIEAEMIHSILSDVTQARKNKPQYGTEVKDKDVMFGAETREDFIRRFGE